MLPQTAFEYRAHDAAPDSNRRSNACTSPDIKAREHARAFGVRQRVPMLNDDPLFVEAPSEIVEAHAAAWLRGSVDAA